MGTFSGRGLAQVAGLDLVLMNCAVKAHILHHMQHDCIVTNFLSQRKSIVWDRAEMIKVRSGRMSGRDGIGAGP